MTVTQDLYTSGAYLKSNPLWHADEAAWKAEYVLRLLAKNRIGPKSLCDVGCGAGEVLRLLRERMDAECVLCGYEISPQAFELCQSRANERLHFKLADIRQEKEGIHFDLMLLMDVLEHMEDYFSFLREVRGRSEYKIIHLPLDVSARTVLFGELSTFRAAYGHIHYFTKDVAIQMLRDVGYEVVDYMYTWQVEPLRVVWRQNRGDPRKLARRLLGVIAREILGVPSRILFLVHRDFAARVMGRWRLLVLTK